MTVPSLASRSDCWDSCVAGGTALRSLNQLMLPRVAPPAAATAGTKRPASRAPATTLATRKRLSRPRTRPAAADVLRMRSRLRRDGRAYDRALLWGWALEALAITRREERGAGRNVPPMPDSVSRESRGLRRVWRLGSSGPLESSVRPVSGAALVTLRF